MTNELPVSVRDRRKVFLDWVLRSQLIYVPHQSASSLVGAPLGAALVDAAAVRAAPVNAAAPISAPAPVGVARVDDSM